MNIHNELIKTNLKTFFQTKPSKLFIDNNLSIFEKYIKLITCKLKYFDFGELLKGNVNNTLIKKLYKKYDIKNDKIFYWSLLAVNYIIIDNFEKYKIIILLMANEFNNINIYSYFIHIISFILPENDLYLKFTLQKYILKGMSDKFINITLINELLLSKIPKNILFLLYQNNHILRDNFKKNLNVPELTLQSSENNFELLKINYVGNCGTAALISYPYNKNIENNINQILNLIDNFY